MIKTPYLSKERIEGKANQLLQAAKAAGKIKYEPPIDVESIIENHLKLGLEIVDFDDIRILGGLDVKNRVIKVNAAVDPYDNSKLQGRYHFTLAHEIGHEILHVPLLNIKNSDAILCRSSHSSIPMEWQADYFAASLLMPRELVFNAFREVFGSLKPRHVDAIFLRVFFDRQFKKMMKTKGRKLSRRAIIDLAFEKLARIFLVSPRAMVFRLEELRLLTLESEWGEKYNRNFVISV